MDQFSTGGSAEQPQRPPRKPAAHAPRSARQPIGADGQRRPPTGSQQPRSGSSSRSSHRKRSDRSVKRRRSSRSPTASRRQHQAATAAIGQPLVTENKAQQWLLRFVDLGFAGLIFLLPYVMGGRQAHGQLLLVCLTAWVSIGWCLLQMFRDETRWVFSRVEWLLLLGVGLVFLQTVELPHGLVQTISPKTEALLPAWQGDAQSEANLGIWNRISLIPFETVDGMVVLICYSLIFIVAVQRIRSQKDVEQMLVCLGISAACMALFGMVQFFTSNEKFFWFYEHPFSSTADDLKGSFTNRNHFAHFMALGIGPLFYWVALTMNRKEKQSTFNSGGSFNASGIAMMALAFVGFALMLSLSRGGMLAGAVAGAVCLLAAYKTDLLSGRIVGGLVGISVLLIAFLAVYGEADVEARMTELVSADAESLDQSGGRRMIWTAVSRAIADFPVLGTGIGSHREVYPTYLSEVPKYDMHEFTHAENGYLQLCLEAGSAGLGLALLGFAIAIIWCVTGMQTAKSSEVTLAFAAGLAAICANLAHSGTDFVWYCPACVVVVILLAACMCRTRHMIRDLKLPQIGSRMPKIGWIACLVGLGFLSIWMVGHKVPRVYAEKPWHDYLRMATSLVPDEDKTDNEIFREKMLALSEAAQADPNHARVQLRLGQHYKKLFEILQAHSDNPMSLTQFRDAAISSQFESKDTLYEWLSRAIEDRLDYLEKSLYHTKRAVALCPLQGRGYLNLSELAFLEMGGASARDEYVKQALAVRPYHPQVLFQAGEEALTALRVDEATEHWKKAFSRNDLVREKIVRLLTPAVNASVMLETFQPDIEGMDLIAGYYRGLNRQQDLRYVLNVYALEARKLSTDDSQDTETRIEHLMTAQRCYSELGDLLKVRQCLEDAIKVDPGAYNPRLAYGNWLYSIQRYGEAAEHLIWCAKRRPSDVKVTTLAEYVRKKSMQQTKNSAFSGPDFEIEQPSNPATGQPTQMATEPTNGTSRF